MSSLYGPTRNIIVDIHLLFNNRILKKASTVRVLIEEKYLLVVQFVPENLMNKEHIHLHERYRIIILGQRGY